MVFLTTKQQMRLYMVPIGISLSGTMLHFWPLFALAVLTVFVLAGMMPLCSGRESLWIFLTSVPTLIPANIFLVRLLARPWISEVFMRTRIDGALWGILAFFTMMSLEEIWLLVLSGVIWREQYDDEMIRNWIERESDKGEKE